ncbi:hypothetical protein C1146_12220 [Clostridium botulinum]|nr:hypothetical protein C1146_12220 [Clostridium botulinum]
MKKINFVKKDDININKIVFNKQNIIYEFTNELLVLGRKYVTKRNTTLMLNIILTKLYYRHKH